MDETPFGGHVNKRVESWKGLQTTFLWGGFKLYKM